MATVDTVLDLLHEKRRRYALYYLDEQNTPVHVSELAEEVARMEAQFNDGGLSDEEIDRRELQLLHETLPKADEAEFIEYDAEAGEVRLVGRPPKFEAILTIAKVLERVK